MKHISALIGLALVAATQANAATLDWSEPLMARTCLNEVRAHVIAQAKPGQVVRYEAQSVLVHPAGEDSFVCLVVGVWHQDSVQVSQRETRSYYAAVKPLPTLKSRVGLVPTL
jgi:hypothetical protein